MNNISEQGNSQPLPFQEIQDQSKPEQICSDPTRNVQLELFNFTSHTSSGVFNNYFIVFSRVGVLEAKYCIENFSSRRRRNGWWWKLSLKTGQMRCGVSNFYNVRLFTASLYFSVLKRENTCKVSTKHTGMGAEKHAKLTKHWHPVLSGLEINARKMWVILIICEWEKYIHQPMFAR